MNYKRAAHYVLPPVVFELTRPFRFARAVRAYHRNHSHSYGYSVYRQQVFKRAIANHSLLNSLQTEQPLPQGYGKDVDERCIEFPWILANLGYDHEFVLDAGSTLNHEYIVSWPGLANKTLHILTLAPETECYWERGISYLYADLRNIPLRDHYYDTIVCASVLEHIGFDNRAYVKEQIYREDRPDDFTQAMKEMRRILKSSGRLLLTVPYGKYERQDWFQQFDQHLLERALEAFGPVSSIRKEFFRQLPEGWVRSNETSCADASYGVTTRGAGAVACIVAEI